MTGSIDPMLQSPGPMTWLALGVALLFGFVVLVAVLRAERNVATVALAVIALVSLGAAASLAMRGNGNAGEQVPGKPAMALPATASLPALACIDDLAGDAVLAACERVLFGSADSVAAAVSYAAARLDQLIARGAVTTVDKTPADQVTLRRSIERDRYGLMSYVLLARDQCQPEACAAFASLSDRSKIVANMEERVYATLIVRYAPTWNAPPVAVTGALAGLPPSVPTGKPTNAEFPSANSIPPINIMTAEPPLAASRPAAAPPAAKKQAAPKAARPPAQPQSSAPPVQLAPPPGRADN